MVGYIVVVEGDETSGYSAYSPDVAGVVATGRTLHECEGSMREAMALHLKWLVEEGDPVPTPTDVAAVLMFDPATSSTSELTDFRTL